MTDSNSERGQGGKTRKRKNKVPHRNHAGRPGADAGVRDGLRLLSCDCSAVAALPRLVCCGCVAALPELHAKNKQLLKFEIGDAAIWFAQCVNYNCGLCTPILRILCTSNVCPPVLVLAIPCMGPGGSRRMLEEQTKHSATNSTTNPKQEWGRSTTPPRHCLPSPYSDSPALRHCKTIPTVCG